MRTSSITPASVTRQKTGGVPVRSCVAVAFGSPTATSTPNEESSWPGIDPPPTVAEALDAGADVVVCSGDKLLGGPQAGLVLGRAATIERLRRHPIARAVRIGKMQLAALEQVLSIIAAGKEGEIPVFRMLRESPDIVRSRAQLLSETIGGELEGARVVRCGSTVGGGSMPGTILPSWGVRIRVPDGPSFAARLRTGTPSAFSRMENGSVLLDCRTVSDAQIRHLARAVHYALEGDEEHDHDVHGGEDDPDGGEPDRGDARA